jgi:hypothetical protein
VTVDQYRVTGISCTSVSQCSAVTLGGSESTFDPRSPGSPGHHAIDPQALASVSCPSASQCTAVDGHGREVTFVPSAPGSPAAVDIDPNQVLTGVKCPSTAECIATDVTGHSLQWDPAIVNSVAREAIPGAATPEGISCPSANECAIADSVGNAFVGFIPVLRPSTPLPAPAPTPGPAGHSPSPAANLFGSATVGRATVHGTRATVRVACHGKTGAKCSVTFRLTSRRNRTNTVALASVHLTLTAGHSSTIRIALGRAGRRLLSAKHRLRAHLSAYQTRAAGQTDSISTQTVTFRASRRR